MAVVEEPAAGKEACAAIHCCLEAKPCAGPTSSLGLSACPPALSQPRSSALPPRTAHGEIAP